MKKVKSISGDVSVQSLRDCKFTRAKLCGWCEWLQYLELNICTDFTCLKFLRPQSTRHFYSSLYFVTQIDASQLASYNINLLNNETLECTDSLEKKTKVSPVDVNIV